MVAVPPPTAATFPSLVTVATDESELLQVNVLSSVVSAGNTVSIKVSTVPFSKVRVLLFNVTS